LVNNEPINRLLSANGGYKVHYKVAMETIAEARNLNTKGKMAESRFALSNKIVFDQLKLNARNKKTTKSTQMWLNVWGKWANKRKFNTKLEEYKHKDLNKKLQMFDTDVRTKNGFFCNFVENIINKKLHDHSCISWYMVTHNVFKVLK